MTMPGSFTPWQERLAQLALEVPTPWLVLPRAPHAGSEHETISYAGLYDYAARVRSALRGRGVEARDRVVFVADNSAPSVLCLLGALAAGVTVVPMPPPQWGQGAARFREALAHVLADCQPRLLLASGGRSLTGDHPVQIAGYEDLLAAPRADGAWSSVSPQDLAIIQYTSGTTARPRGVALTGANVLHNVNSIGVGVGVRPGEVGVCWLPMYHDMGLIGFLHGTFWGMSMVLLRPRMFQLRPESWLWAVARFRASYSMAPNSAYQLCASKITDQKISGLDLSTWRVAFNGADLIHPSTVGDFSARFGRHGFRAETMYPVYGLAEHTLAATMPEPQRWPDVDWIDNASLDLHGRAPPATDRADARGVICVGRPISDTRLRVVCPTTGAALAERSVGEVQLQGPSATAGYWSRGELSREPFTDDGWLRTGDRGYVVDGALYPVGRYKNVAKRLGRNIDCGFVAAAVAREIARRAENVAVFGDYDPRTGTEKLVIAVEGRSDLAEEQGLKDDIEGAVRALLSFAPDEIVILPRGAIPRTTSGKVRHAEAARLYQERRHATQ